MRHQNSKNTDLTGGPGRTPTCNQTVMSGGSLPGPFCLLVNLAMSVHAHPRLFTLYQWSIGGWPSLRIEPAMPAHRGTPGRRVPARRGPVNDSEVSAPLAKSRAQGTLRVVTLQYEPVSGSSPLRSIAHRASIPVSNA